MSNSYVHYHPGVENVEDDEAEVIGKIIAVMSEGGDVVAAREGKAFRTSHAKAHALAAARLRVAPGLEPELAQGLFAEPKTYDAIVRLSHVPGEPLDDRCVSTPRGLALKVLNVTGSTLHGAPTQDWVLDAGDVFIAKNAKTFLSEIAQTEAAVPLPEAAKATVSAAARGANAALWAIGVNSALLDFFGHPTLNPLTETYFSQAPIRYGDYIAKLRLRPAGRTADEKIALESENALRDIVAAELAASGAEFALEVQLCADLDRMPVEDAHARWSEEDSPYREVARLILPPQDANPAKGGDSRDDDLSFCPAHTLDAHRPLGSIMRARMKVYEIMATRRRGAPIAEPASGAPASA